jgi:hypothetical protein
LASVANNAAGFNIEGNASDRQPHLIAEAGDETQKTIRSVF